MAITLKEALKIVNQRQDGWPVPFNIECISFDSNTYRSGKVSELKKIENAIKVKASHNSKKLATISFKELNKRGVHTAHIKLITKINGQWVE